MNPNATGGKLQELPDNAEFRVQRELSPGSNNTSIEESDPRLKPLTFPEETFVREYVKDFRLERAARRAGMDRKNMQALLQLPHIRYRLDQIQNARSSELEVDQKEIVKFLYSVITADLSEVMEHYRGCCRYCWGYDAENPDILNHEYQYKNKAERIEARAKHKDKYKLKKRVPHFSNGGLGYDKFRIPNPDCPECNGDGISQVLIKDTNASGPARHLVQSVNINSAGKVEVRLHDKVRVAELLMRHLGMLQKDSSVTDIVVKVEGGLNSQISAMSGKSLAELEAQINEEANRKINEA
jgi:hypothetical protein